MQGLPPNGILKAISIPSAEGLTPLHYAILNGRHHTVEAMLQYLTPTQIIAAITSAIASVEHRGKTALYLAAESQQIFLLESMLEAITGFDFYSKRILMLTRLTSAAAVCAGNNIIDAMLIHKKFKLNRDLMSRKFMGMETLRIFGEYSPAKWCEKYIDFSQYHTCRIPAGN